MQVIDVLRLTEKALDRVCDRIRSLPGVRLAGGIMQRGKLRIDPDRHICHWDGKAVALTVTEALVLISLVSRPGVVRTRDALMDAAYDDQVYVDDRTIDMHVKRLRKKFEAVDAEFSSIETLHGIGYRYNLN